MLEKGTLGFLGFLKEVGCCCFSQGNTGCCLDELLGNVGVVTPRSS